MKVFLEEFKVSDIPKLISWIPDKEFLLQWSGPRYTFPLNEEQLLSELNMTLNKPPKILMFSAKLADTNETVGHIQLLGIDLVNKSCRIGRVIVGDKELRGKGIGLKMINCILDIVFNSLKLHRVDLSVFDFNKSAIACYEKAGFKIEGKRRECIKIKDKYWSSVTMSMLEHEYKDIIRDVDI